MTPHFHYFGTIHDRIVIVGGNKVNKSKSFNNRSLCFNYLCFNWVFFSFYFDKLKTTASWLHIYVFILIIVCFLHIVSRLSLTDVSESNLVINIIDK